MLFSMRLLPALNVSIYALATLTAVRPVGNDLVVSMLTGAVVDVGMLPGIQRNLLRKIRAVPVFEPRRPGAQRLQTLVGRGISTYVQAVGTQRRFKRSDLRFGGIYFRLVQVFKDAWHHERRQHRQNCQYNQEFNERETALSVSLHLFPHIGSSLML